jgi:hypothetical protein
MWNFVIDGRLPNLSIFAKSGRLEGISDMLLIPLCVQRRVWYVSLYVRYVKKRHSNQSPGLHRTEAIERTTCEKEVVASSKCNNLCSVCANRQANS